MGCEVERHECVAQQCCRQQDAGVSFAESESDEVENEDDRQPAVREQADETGCEQQPPVSVERA
jgi:hypothetical protein